MKRLFYGIVFMLVGMSLGYLLFGRTGSNNSVLKSTRLPETTTRELSIAEAPSHVTHIQDIAETAPFESDEQSTAAPAEHAGHSKTEPTVRATDELQPLDNAQSNEPIIVGILNADETELDRLRSEVDKEYLRPLSQKAGIQITKEESDLLSKVFIQATVAFCQQWDPVMEEGLRQSGPARDRLLLFEALGGDRLLLLYAIPSRREEITTILGKERYERMLSSVNADFLEWYKDLTNSVKRSNQ